MQATITLDVSYDPNEHHDGHTVTEAIIDFAQHHLLSVKVEASHVSVLSESYPVTDVRVALLVRYDENEHNNAQTVTEAIVDVVHTQLWCMEVKAFEQTDAISEQVA